MRPMTGYRRAEFGSEPAVELESEPESGPESVAPVSERGLEILARRAPKFALEHDAVADAPRTETLRNSELEDAEELSNDTLETGSSSLLAMGSGFPRPAAVRIEEPHSDEIEPVVIFPGQGARGFSDTAQQSAFSPNAPYARPSLAPTGADAPAAAQPANQANPEETERALRAALASLQRISGAR